MEQVKTTVVPYGNGIYGIDQQMVRAFLLVGTTAALLLDTGIIPMGVKPYIRELTDLPLTVVLTHGDGDHIGNLPDFAAAFAHEKDMAAITSHPGCQNVSLQPLAEGQLFDIGDRRLKVLFTPGHTAGSVCLLDEENKLLFAGDTVSYGPVYMFGARRDMQEYLRTLYMLKEMKDSDVFHTVYCCHGSCPIPADTTDALISCVNGILDQTIPGVPVPAPIPTAEKTLLAKFGPCAILF